mmetsp:Transcript_35574/g.54369  ORF Transcript_35574/g.54369 Transcript_35574/m.54369 type:complete len:211 (-) Transcript_35574:749-1381(-)
MKLQVQTSPKEAEKALKAKQDSLSSEFDTKVSKAHKETEHEKISNIEEVSYNGKKIPLKTERLKVIFKKVENFQADINSLKMELTGDKGSLVKKYLDFVNVLEDAQGVIKKDRAEEAKKSEQSGQFFTLLLQYIHKLKLKALIDRNLLQASLLDTKLNIKELFTRQQGHNVTASAVRPQNIVRFLEKAIKSQKQLVSSGKGDQQDPIALL